MSTDAASLASPEVGGGGFRVQGFGTFFFFLGGGGGEGDTPNPAK